MTGRKSASATLAEGVNDPSPITRVIALDWYDGPVEGVLQLGEDGAVFRFSLLDERKQADSTDIRVFGLYPLPPEAFSRLVELISGYVAPSWPVWWPIWKFPSEEIRKAIDDRTEDILREAGPLNWIVVGDDLGVGGIRALQVVAARAS